MTAIPVIDVSPLLKASDGGVDEVARSIDAACRDTGFFLIDSHGVPPEALTRLDHKARAFFALPENVKASVSMDRGGRAWRGWFPEGGELTSGQPDHKEGLYCGTDLAVEDPRVRAGVPLHGPNLLPDDDVPGLRPAIDDWMSLMTGLGHLLLEGVALGLGLDRNWFATNLTADPTLLFRIFRYPAPGPEEEPSQGVGEHTDYGLLTILAHDGRPGLQVKSGGDWVDVPDAAGSFVINIGDMLDRLTGGRYRSTPHRVVRSGPGESPSDRLSFPFFFDPSWDARIVTPPLDGSPPPDDRATRWDSASVHEWEGTYGDYLWQKVSRVFPHLAGRPAD